MNKALNRKTSRILGALIIAALTLVMIFSAFSATTFAHADDEVDLTFTQTDVSPSNGNFANTSSSSTPYSPDGWTGGGLGDAGSGNTVAGVMNLTTYLANKDSYKLDKFFEGSSSPNSPFGQGSYEGNRNVLLINVLSDSTAYGFTSGTVTFTANRFYLVEAWVSTGKFASDSGAAIRVNGLDEDIVFNNIDTSESTADYGWEKFSFYIASSSLEDKSVTVSLQVGDRNDDYFYPALGYAMFDNVSVLEIAPSTFYEAHESAHAKIYDLSNKTSEQFGYLENLDFTASVPDSNGWALTSAGEDMTKLTIGTYDARNTFDDENKFHLTSDPYSANGKYDKGDSSVLVISSYYGNQFRSVAAGVSSKPVTVERYHYYRISVWAKSQEVTEGSGATFALSAIRDEAQGVGRYEGKNMFATITSCTGDTENKARGGFSQYSFYVKGSALRDYDVNIECWLGTPDNKSRGVALFDNVTVEEITPADYTAYNVNGTVVDLDSYAGIDGSAFITYPSTGITNGNFYEIDAYEEFGYPLAPLGWTMYTASEAATNGYSVANVSADNAIYGIIPTDNETFDKYNNNGSFGNIAFNPENNGANLLMLYSPDSTAFCYRSSTFTVTASTPGKLTVTLMTSGMSSSDYGASLVLKNDTSIISTIEKINTNNAFKTYTFYIEPSSVDISALSVEVWLGNIDRNKNTTKLSKGLIYVKEAAYEDIADDYASDGTTVTKTAAQKFSEYKAACDNDKVADLTITRAAYSFNGIDASAYDYYDTSFVKYPYNWQMSATGTFSNAVHYGIFNPASPDRNTSLVPASFNMDELSSNNVLMLYNAGPASSTLTYNGSLDITAETYYRIDVAVKVDIPEQERENAVGAKLTLNGDKSVSFENIKDTSTVSDSIVNKEAFKTYSFYIYPGASDNSVSLSISLGESAYSKQCSGRVYIGSITITDINSDLYNTAVEETAKRDDGEEYNTAYERVLIADYSTEAEPGDDVTDTENPDEGSSLEWWLIPSILFAVAILIAIVGFIIRKAMEKRVAKKTTVAKTVSYDRNATLNVEHNKNADDENKVAADTVASDEQYEAFDDDAAVENKAELKDANSEEVQEEHATENSSEETEKADAPTEETAQAPAEEKTEESKAPVRDTFIDRFDD